jgi:hypothetical protein
MHPLMMQLQGGIYEKTYPATLAGGRAVYRNQQSNLAYAAKGVSEQRVANP